MPRSSLQKPEPTIPKKAIISEAAPVHHGCVHNLAPARVAGLQQGANHPESEVHAAAAEVANEVERQNRGLALPADVVQGAGQRDVVDVVTSSGGVRTLLAPAGHPAVDQSRVAGQTVLRPDPESLGHAGAEPLQHRVGSVHKRQHRLEPASRLEVDAD